MKDAVSTTRRAYTGKVLALRIKYFKLQRAGDEEGLEEWLADSCDMMQPKLMFTCIGERVPLREMERA